MNPQIKSNFDKVTNFLYSVLIIYIVSSIVFTISVKQHVNISDIATIVSLMVSSLLVLNAYTKYDTTKLSLFRDVVIISSISAAIYGSSIDLFIWAVIIFIQVCSLMFLYRNCYNPEFDNLLTKITDRVKIDDIVISPKTIRFYSKLDASETMVVSEVETGYIVFTPGPDRKDGKFFKFGLESHFTEVSPSMIINSFARARLQREIIDSVLKDTGLGFYFP